VLSVIDTGAAISLFPLELLELIPYEPVSSREIILEQAGIAQQEFSAVEARITLLLEDSTGTLTPPVQAICWFAETNVSLVGFADILDHAILHIDALKLDAWLEFVKK
jgi:hypothetical protein